MDGKEEITSLNAEIGGHKLKVTGPGTNLIITFIAAISSIIGIVILIGHEQSTDKASMSIVNAIREQTVVIKEQITVAREQNCLISMPMDNRDPEFCRRISR